MRDLHLAGLHEDGEHLLLEDSEGASYLLRVDEPLRAAVRRDRPLLGLLQAEDMSSLRPRDIQAMLRRGHSSAEIAEIADIDLDHVRRYEGPILAERSFTAHRARGFRIGRGGGPTLDEAVNSRLARREASDPAWDAWRREDDSWTLELVFRSGGRDRAAHWIVDVSRQTLVPEDEEASWLTDDSDPDGAPATTRLRAVPGRVYDVEADGGVDDELEDDEPDDAPSPTQPTSAERAAHPSAGHPSRQQGESGSAGIDEQELDEINRRRGMRVVRPGEGPTGESRPARVLHRSEDEPEEPTWTTLSDDDALTEELSPADRARAAGREPDAESAGTDGDGTRGPDETALPGLEEDAPAAEDAPAGSGPAEAEAEDGADPEPAPEPASEKAPKDAKAPKAPAKNAPARKGRSSVPSWDEILFGSKHSKD